MAGQETARSIAFSVRKLVIQPLNNGNGVTAGVPIVVDTPESVEIKLDVALDEVRGGAYLFPLAVDPKEMKLELMGKLTDCPPTLLGLLTIGTYSKNVVAGPQLDAGSLVNIVGSSVVPRLTITTPGAPVSGLYAVVASDTTHYQVYDMSTGKAAAAVLITGGGTDTASITGVTITFTTGVFVAGDVANFEILNIGAAGVTGDASAETVLGPSSFPSTPPQCQIVADATRRGVIYQWILYYAVLEGVAFPMKQGGYVVPDFKARIQQPPFGAPQTPWRYRRVA